MYIERVVSPVQASFFKSSFNEFNKKKETFHEMFQHTLNSNSNARSPKIELTGVLVPCNKVAGGLRFKFKLETNSNEYFLRMSDVLDMIASKAEWETVTVTGSLALEGNIFEVEKMKLAPDYMAS